MPLRRRDKIALEKILSELDIGLSIMNGYSKEEFLANEVIKRAMAMTAINIGELVKTYIELYLGEVRRWPYLYFILKEEF